MEAEEIGDGNINYVLQIRNPDTNGSLVIKQADKQLYSSGRPMDIYRNKIEVEILKIESHLAKGYVLEIVYTGRGSQATQAGCAQICNDYFKTENRQQKKAEQIFKPEKIHWWKCILKNGNKTGRY